jgi:hypothetical protein
VAYPVRPDAAGRPCWPIISLWLLSIAQYSYRYILQVNDTADSHEYGPTPPLLSAIKYEIFLVFALYCVFRFCRKSIPIHRRYLVLAWVTAGLVLALLAVFVARLITEPGDLSNTTLSLVQFVPWVCSAFFIPLAFNQQHSLDRTLSTFERITFWIALPFWAVTVALAIAGVRYPALSYPGVIVRFGGILDDPNAYAGLCVLLIVLAVTFKSGAWRARACVYGLMLLPTLSLSGYVMAIATGVYLVASPLWKPIDAFRPSPLKLCVRSAIAMCILAASAWIYQANEPLIDAISSIYSAKSNSAGNHLSNLLPASMMFDISSPITIWLGGGGYSESFYWRMLINFGWLGFLIVVCLVILWVCEALPYTDRYYRPIAAWLIGFLVASNGIAYVLLFPISLLFWSILAVLVLIRAPEPASI